MVHRPSFLERYHLFWGNASTPESTQALVYATLFAGVVSMDAGTIRMELGGERGEWVKTLEKAAAISLSRANVIRTEKPETIQAFVMYLVSEASVAWSLKETCSKFQRRGSKACHVVALIVSTDSPVSKHHFPYPCNTGCIGY